MAISQLYPNSRPTLNLNFARSKTLDPRITFTRNSTATYVGSDGLIQTAAASEARFDHDGTGKCQGLLIEEARTNFFTYSVNLSQQWGTERASITSNTTVAPDGTTTATTATEDTSNNSHLVSGYPHVPQNGSGTHTFSVFAKAKERSVIALSTNESTGAHAVATFDLQAGVISQSGDDPSKPTVDYVGSSIVDVGNGWYRCSLTYASTNNVWPVIGIANTPTYSYTNYGRCNYQGDGTSGIYIWGVQMERFSSFPTSYIPTSGSTSTRVADVCEITGTNFSSWYNQSETTLVIHQSINKTGSSNHDPWRLYGSGSLRGQVGYGVPNSGLIYMDVWPTFTGYLSGYSAGNNWQVGQQNKAAFSWYIPPASNPLTAQTEASGSLNGQSPVTANNMAPIGNRTSFRPLSSNSGTIEYISFYSTRLTDSQLQELTS